MRFACLFIRSDLFADSQNELLSLTWLREHAMLEDMGKLFHSDLLAAMKLNDQLPRHKSDMHARSDLFSHYCVHMCVRKSGL